MRTVAWALLALVATGCAEEAAPAIVDDAVASGETLASEGGAVAPPRYEGTFSAALMTGVCMVEMGVCPSVAKEIGWPIWTPEANASTLAALGPSEWVFTAEWTPTGPNTERVVVEIGLDDEAGYVLQEEGASPFVLRLPLETFAPGRSYGIRATPVTGGVFIEQEVRFTMELRPLDAAVSS